MHIQNQISETEMVVITDDTISRLTRQLVSGTSPSGKEWSRWRSASGQFFSWKSGYLNVYMKQRIPQRHNQHHRSVITFANMTAGPQYIPQGSPVAAALANRVGVYPIPQKYGFNMQPLQVELSRQSYPLIVANERWIPTPGAAKLLRADSFDQGVRAMFGSTRYRRDLLKAIVATSSLNRVIDAAQFRGLVPIDWIVSSLKGDYVGSAKQDFLGSEGAVLTTRDLAMKRLLLNSLNQKTVKHLLQKPSTPWHMRDTLTSFRTIRELKPEYVPVGTFNGWNDLHDLLASDARKIQTENRAIEQSYLAEKLDGQVSKNYRLVSAKETHDLVGWGTTMSNCIGGYAERATRLQTNLFGVFQGDALIANMEVANTGMIRQLVGKNNRSLDHDADKEIQKLVYKTQGKQYKDFIPTGRYFDF